MSSAVALRHHSATARNSPLCAAVSAFKCVVCVPNCAISSAIMKISTSASTSSSARCTSASGAPSYGRTTSFPLVFFCHRFPSGGFDFPTRRLNCTSSAAATFCRFASPPCPTASHSAINAATSGTALACANGSCIGSLIILFSFPF